MNQIFIIVWDNSFILESNHKMNYLNKCKVMIFEKLTLLFCIKLGIKVYSVH